MIEERITRKELIKMYQIDISTVKNWVRDRGLPMIQISTHKSYIRKEDLIDWENKIKKNESK